MKKLVLATGNPGKLREIRALLEPLGVEVVTQAELGIAEAEEPHETFLENALAKARHASARAGLPALADDSGLCVPALGGEPGVHSAYYAGREGDRATRDRANNDRLVSAMRAIEDRRAHYHCVMLLIRHARDPQPLVAEASWHGEIAREAAGSGGFGYDPVFRVSGRDCTAAELDPGEKNRLSHRGRALQVLIARLRAEG